MEKLVLKKGGKLIKTDWIYDPELDQGQYIDKDVTENGFNYMQEYCEIDGDVTLKDVFLLLNNKLELYDLLLRNWTKEIVKEGLSDVPSKEETEIEYIELYRQLEYQKFEENGPFKLIGTHRPDLHGIGFELTEDRDGHKKGSRVTYSLSFQKTTDLINLPVKLKYDMPIYKSDYFKELMDSHVITFDYVPYTLFDILYGIVWELSFFGPPSQRDEKGEEILGIFDEFKKSLDKQEKV